MILLIFLYFISANSPLKLQGSRHIIIRTINNKDKFIALKRDGRKNNKSEVKIINNIQFLINLYLENEIKNNKINHL